MRNIVAFLAGLLFSAGLTIAGMTDPHRIRAFLDITGGWDPSLVVVMLVAAGSYALGYRSVRRRARPALDREWHLPQKAPLTPALFLGAAIFGAGWGISGYCPGPALASLPSLTAGPWVFLGGVLLGMGAFYALNRWRPIRR